MPLPIQVGSVTQALQRAFGFKGRYTPMLDEVIVPVWIVQDPAPAVVTRLASCSPHIAQSSSVTFLHLILWNPPASGVLGVVNAVNIQVYGDGGVFLLKPHEINVHLTVTDVPPSPSGVFFPGVFRDARFGGVPAALTGIADRDALANTSPLIATFQWQVGPGGGREQSVKGESTDPRQPLAVLTPGSFLEVTNELIGVDTDNEPEIRVIYQWLEVPITELGPLGGIPGT